MNNIGGAHAERTFLIYTIVWSIWRRTVIYCRIWKDLSRRKIFAENLRSYTIMNAKALPDADRSMSWWCSRFWFCNLCIIWAMMRWNIRSWIAWALCVFSDLTSTVAFRRQKRFGCSAQSQKTKWQLWKIPFGDFQTWINGIPFKKLLIEVPWHSKNHYCKVDLF